MAKWEGDQEIPAEWLDLWRGNLTDKSPKNITRKRYPYRVPTMQTHAGHPSAKQKTQRARLIVAMKDFAGVNWPTRQRWFAAAPETESFLWYYNYFIMSSLRGNADIPKGGVGVIKSIQFVKEEVPTTGGKAFTIEAVDPAKTVVMLFGNSFISDTVQRGSDIITSGGTKNHALSPNVDPTLCEVRIRGSGGFQEIEEGTGDGYWSEPYASALTASQLTVKMIARPLSVSAGYAWEVIERKAQTIYPVIVSIAAESVNIDWSKVPSVAADVTIIAIEYI